MNPFERSICGNTTGFRNQHRRRPWLAVHAGFALWLLPLAQAQDPIITLQPTNQTAMAGVTVNVFMSVQATSTNGPMTYQWQRDDPAAPMTFTNIPNGIESRLSLRNVTLDDTGDYRAVVFNAGGDSVISEVAHPTVKAPDFTRITEGPLVTTSGIDPMHLAWGDINNDGYEDLIIGDLGSVDWNRGQPSTRAVPQVYLNNRGGSTFRRATEDDIGPLATSATAGGTVALADYDNDGYLDFYQNAWFETCRLWRGGPNGRFTLVTENIGPNVIFHGEGTWGYAWGDYDRDGFLDLYVTTAWSSFGGTTDYLFHNLGNGTFERLPSPLALSVSTQFGFWADYDNDGDPDLLVTSVSPSATYLYRNDGPGQFTPVSLPAPTGFAPVWGDYDNDGDLDLFRNGLLENDGAGGFAHKAGEGIPPIGLGYWVDIDNDGRVELIVGDGAANKYRLYRCDPRSKLWSEELSSLHAIQVENRFGAWADYDNDGFMDFAVASRPNKLYRNNGNGNHWLHVKPVGTRSNRSAIGARITVEAAIFGKLVSQMREINSTCFNQSLRAHFGLGDAAQINRLIIRWPNGAREELTGIAPNRILTVVEPSVHATRQPDGSIQLQVWGNAGRTYSVQTSTDFETWTTLDTVTGKGTEGPVEITDPATDGPRRFYRMTVP
jgi:enediyne biosynthesis protein E4